MNTHKNRFWHKLSLTKPSDLKWKAFNPFFDAPRATRNRYIYFHGKIEVKVTPKESKESVYVYLCSNYNLKIDGKANEIMLEGCKKFSVVLDDVISSIEVINSWNI